MLKANSTLKQLDVSSNWVGLSLETRDAPGFAQELAAGIKDNGAMTSLDMSKNGLLTKEGGEILGKMLKTNSVLKDLNVSQSGWGLSGSKQDGPGFAQKLAVGIKDNGALTFLDLSSNSLTGKYGEDMSGNTELSAVIQYRTTPDLFRRFYRPCQRHPRHGGVDVPQSFVQ
jgi:hypothetical protein